MSDFTASSSPGMSAADAITARRTALRTLGLDSTTPLPAWVILNGVRNQCFSGEVTLFTLPAVRVWAVDGHVYWAERPGAQPVVDRLVELGALTAEQARLGSVRLGDVAYLGHLFERVDGIDRDEVLRALDYVRDSITAEIADLLTERVDVVQHRHHPSGMVFWFDDEHAVPAPERDDATPAALPAVIEASPPVASPPVAPPPVAAPTTEPPDAEVVLAVRSVLDEIRAALGRRDGGQPVPAPSEPSPAPRSGSASSLPPVWDLPFGSLLDPAPSPAPASRPADAAPPAPAEPSIPTTPAPLATPPSTDPAPPVVDAVDRHDAAGAGAIAEQAECVGIDIPDPDPDLDDLDNFDDFGPVGPAAPRRVSRAVAPVTTYSAPVEYELEPSPVVSITDVGQQPASGLRRLIGGRRR